MTFTKEFDSWDFTFMLNAKLWATKSKDPSRKIGAVITQGRKPVAQGYNGFPKKMADNYEKLVDREQKYMRTIHAEMNALHNALQFGANVIGGSIYVYGLPVCSVCALNLIQADIKEIIFCDIDSTNSIWENEKVKTMTLLEESGVSIREMLKKDLDNYESMCYKGL